MDKIIIVESPSKSKTIQGYLGKGYKVLSSKGHICDLATSGKEGLGVDVNNGFAPTYKIMKEKEDLVNTLIKQCKGHEVYLATDPDREGEAIAYHLANTLGLSLYSQNRIEFHEITKTAVNEAIANPHSINLKMVDSQETRRIIDRILGFKLSKLLQRKIGSKSAGRVQSVALYLIVDLEKKILAFVPEKYYEMEAIGPSVKLKLSELNGVEINAKNRITDRSVLEDLLPRLLSFKVTDISAKQQIKPSMPTYTTSTLQQDASIKLNYTATKTMNIAQKLYEGKNVGSETVGLITYMRTDSTRLADTFVKSADQYILNNYGAKYLGSVKNKKQKGAQDAHEGIRPTSIDRTPESIKGYLTDEEYKLYNLIYKRTIASLMSNAVFNVTKVEFENTDSKWTTSGKTLTFDGYLKVYGKDIDDENELIRDYKLGDTFTLDQINILDKETEGPSRYTEASLIKDMEELGIGRPSTYAQTIQTLKDREYIKLSKKNLVPTEQGIMTTDKLQEFFSGIINVKYTANMETNLDKIAEGNENRLNELSSFYNSFIPLFDVATANMDALYPIETDEICPICGNKLVIRLGKYGEFTACSNYPDCKYIKKDEEAKPESDDTGILCPKCKKSNIVSRLATRGKNAGKLFYACGNYPKCKNTYNDKPTNEVCPSCNSIMLEDENGNKYCSSQCMAKADEILCPVCQTGKMVPRVASRGKNKGKTFYACSNFPKCKNTYNDKPLNDICPKCGSIMLEDENGNKYCGANCDKVEIIDPIKVDEPVKVETKITCPTCGKGELVERVAKKGNNSGNTFYACNKFPKCKTVVSKEDYLKLISK